MEVSLVMPTSLDALHLILAGLVLILLVIAIVRGGKSSNRSVDTHIIDSAESTERPPEVEAPALKTSDPAAAMQLLGLLQQEARFVDFLKEDLTGFNDAEIGAVARVLHEGGRKLLDQYFLLETIRAEEEESRVTLAPGFDSAENRVTGNVVGEPPFTGTLVHRGWRVAQINLPKLAPGHNPKVLAPAEVEL